MQLNVLERSRMWLLALEGCVLYLNVFVHMCTQWVGWAVIRPITTPTQHTTRLPVRVCTNPTQSHTTHDILMNSIAADATAY